MNEQRIREIANQASDHAENTVEYFPDTEDGLDYPAKMMKIRDLKFAELIVRECISINDRHYDANIASDEILEHFGVEE